MTKIGFISNKEANWIGLRRDVSRVSGLPCICYSNLPFFEIVGIGGGSKYCILATSSLAFYKSMVVASISLSPFEDNEIIQDKLQCDFKSMILR